MKTLHLTIATVDSPLFDGDALSVYVHGSEGDMTILPEHTALVSGLRPGLVRVTDVDNIVHEYRIVQNGTVEVSNNAVTILL